MDSSTINTTDECRPELGRAADIAALAEVGAMLLLVLSYIWLWQRTFPGHTLVVVFLYFAICLVSHVRCGESARDLGLRLDNWRCATRQVCGPVALAVAAALAVGAVLGSWHFDPIRLYVELPWHLVWGTAQQYGLLCLIYRRLLDLLASPWGAALGAASAFALFHWPNPLLVAVTLVAGCISCVLYRRAQNVLVLGVAHAVISMVLFSALPLSVTHALRVGPGYYTLALGAPHAP